jgi:glycosyltransferase involved in cell wall biosynthesis
MNIWHAMNAAYAWLSLHATPVFVSVHGNDFIRPYMPIVQPHLHQIPYLWRVHRAARALNFWLARRLTRGLMARSWPYVCHILANSRYTEKILLQRYPVCQGKTSVAFVGVPEEFFQSDHVDRVRNQPVRLITVSRLSDPRKNVEKVLRALAQLKSQYEFTYTVIGDGDLRPGLEALSRQVGLGQDVEFAGTLPRTEIKKRLASSDLFILPSSTLRTSIEGFGIAYLEANACGTPVLAARLAGAAEAVGEGVSGMFVNEPTVDSIASALRSYFSGEVTFEASRCKAFARQFTWTKVVDRACEIYAAKGARAENPN